MIEEIEKAAVDSPEKCIEQIHSMKKLLAEAKDRS